MCMCVCVCVGVCVCSCMSECICFLKTSVDVLVDRSCSAVLFIGGDEQAENKKAAEEMEANMCLLVCVCVCVCVRLRLHINVCMLACVMDRGLYERGIG